MISDFKKGVTLLEISLSVGLLLLIGAAVMVSFANSRRSRDLATAGGDVLSILRLAQTRALAGEEGSQWGVRLEQSQAILFRGSVYSASAASSTYVLPAAVEIANLVLGGGGQEIVFRRLDGRTANAGTFELRLRDAPSRTFPITVDSSGRTYQTGTAPAQSGTRINDARHRNFMLGWSIRNALTLTLTFSDPPNPDLVYPVVMLPPPPRTSFDWSGTVAVGGQDQTMRIHTLSITDSDTILSVDRDCRSNTKKVKIEIDAKVIATYEADCRTVTVGAFGGAMSEP